MATTAAVLSSTSRAQWAHLNSLRQCRSLDQFSDLVMSADRDGLAPSFNSETIATTCQALIQYKNPSGPLLNTLRKWSTASIRNQISPSAASKFLQSSAIFASDPNYAPIMNKLIDRFRQGLSDCSPGGIVGGCLSIASAAELEIDPELWGDIADHIDRTHLVSQLSLSQMTKLAGAITRSNLHIRHPNLMAKTMIPMSLRLKTVTSDELGSLSMGRCAELVWSFSKGAVLPKEWSENILCPRLMDDMGGMTTKNLSQIICAMAHSAICPSALFSTLERRLHLDDIDRVLCSGVYSQQSLANLCWSLAVARRPTQLPSLFSALVKSHSSFGPRELAQVHLAFEWADRFHLRSIETAMIIPKVPEMRAEARRIFTSTDPIRSATSDFHESVVSAAKQLWPNIQTEVQCPKSGYWLDMVNPDKNDVWEINGPQHYCRLSSRARGATLLKASIVRKSGWNLRSIPFYEWTFGPGNIDAHVGYLRVKNMGKEYT